MNDFLQRLKQRKLVQWAIAYVAGAFALIQVLDVVSDSYAWPRSAMHIVFGVLVLGFVVALVLAWYHGERGAQRISGPELLLIALVLAVGGGLLWHFARGGSATSASRNTVASTRSPDGAQRYPGNSAQRNPGNTAPNSAAVATKSPDTAAGAAGSGLHSAQAIPAKSIAVLPFENLSDDKKNEYFVEGMQDLILTKLADIGDLKVISRTSTERYKSHPSDLKTIGQQLGVATILEGSVQKAGDQVLINVQLIDAKTDSHIWAQAYTRKLDNIFGVEGDVAEKIATALKAKLSPAETARLATSLSPNNAANDLFLRADYQANRAVSNYDTAHFRAAIPLYQQAIQKDPNFALAYARLSFSESVLAWFGGGGENAKQLTQQARADAGRALQLAPNLAASQLALGYSDYYGKGDYAAALQAFDAALALRPNDANALAARGFVERRQGRFDAAIASLTQALAHDPRNSVFAFEIGSTCMLASRYAEAETWFQRALALDPNNLNAKTSYSNAILLRTGDVARALTAAQGNASRLKLQRASLLPLQRKYREAIALLESIHDIPDNSAYTSVPKALLLADLYRLAGDTAKARSLFEQVLPKARAQLAQQQGINLAFVWQNVADAELGLGHIAEGLDAIAKVQKVVANNRDQEYGPALMETNASLYAEAKRPDLAVPLLAKTLATPGIGSSYSPVLLWLDPSWDPIRHDPRFQALLKKYAKYKPVVTYDNPAPAASTSAAASSSAP